MITQFPTPPGDDFKHNVVIGMQWIIPVISAWIGYRFGLRSQIFAKRLAIKTDMLPLINKFILRANDIKNGWHGLRPESIEELITPAKQLESLLNGRKRMRLIGAWNEFSSMTPAEFHIPQPNENEDQVKAMQKTFLERLNALKSVVEST